MDFFEIIWDLFFWGIGFVCLIIACTIGMFAYYFLRGIVVGIGELMPIKVSFPFVDILVRAVVIVIAIVLCFMGDISLGTVIHDFFSMETFNDLAASFQTNENMFILNNAIDVFWHQLIITFIFFLPYFIVEEVIHVVRALFSDKEEYPLYGYVSYPIELLTLIATNIFVLYMGNTLAVILLEFIQSIKLKFGLFRMLWRMLLFCIYMFRVVCDMFGTDLFLSMMAMNIAAMVFGVDLSGSSHTLILLLSVVVGYGSKALRNFIINWFADQGSDSEGNELLSLFYGIFIFFVMILVCLLIMKVVGV